MDALRKAEHSQKNSENRALPSTPAPSSPLLSADGTETALEWEPQDVHAPPPVTETQYEWVNDFQAGENESGNGTPAWSPPVTEWQETQEEDIVPDWLMAAEDAAEDSGQNIAPAVEPHQNALPPSPPPLPPEASILPPKLGTLAEMPTATPSSPRPPSPPETLPAAWREQARLARQQTYARRWRFGGYGVLLVMVVGTGATMVMFSGEITDWLAGESSSPYPTAPPRRTATPSPPMPAPLATVNAAPAPLVNPPIQAASASTLAPPPMARPQPEPPAPQPMAAPPVLLREQAPAAPQRARNDNEQNEEESTRNEGIVVKIRSAKTAVAPDLQQGFHALERGQWATAHAHYQAALRRDPRNFGALHGLAVAQARAGDTRAAKTRYQELLRQYPNDPLALAALAMLDADAGLQDVSKLAALAARLPPEQSALAASLYFTIGTLHYRQARWPEAQQAFFNAHAHDSQHPDYAYNLAVSLDHLGKPAAALPYYRQALALAARRAAGFDANALRQRMDAIASQAE